MKHALLRTSADIAQLGTILFIGAHPDDETYCAGATLATAVRNGQRVICATATRGEKGVQDPKRWPQEKLGEIRSQELQAALKELGVQEHYWFGYRDGECDQVSRREAAQLITSLIDQHSIDSILTFGPDGLTGHSDHRAVSHWVDEAALAAHRKPTVYHVAQLRESYEKYLKRLDETHNIFFNIDHPQLVDQADCAICFKADLASLACKHNAFAAMPSQMETLLHVVGDNFAEAFGTEAFVLATASRR